MSKILVTGGSGFLASHILKQLLTAGHAVVTTVRSETKAQTTRATYSALGLKDSSLDIVVVPDITQDGAFDGVAKTPGLTAVLHTQSPFHFNWTDPQTGLIDPAVRGTTGLLKSVHQHAPGVRRVVVTSSFAAILNGAHLEDPNTTFTEASWNPVTLADIHNAPGAAYAASKKLAEQAAFAYVRENSSVPFDIVSVCPPNIFGPVAHHIDSVTGLNTSSQGLAALLQGEWRKEIPATDGVCLWVDVRDCAQAHVKALDTAAVPGSQRLFATAGYFGNRAIAAAARRNFPEYSGSVPGANVAGGDEPAEDKRFKFDNSATNKILGIQWTSLEQSTIDAVKSLKPLLANA
ncbi:methylglyoxal reductase (NADPH-dependent) gre2 [Sporothrix eucalyptigena]|uniref:Methylglyoxal reductase (NADPH-dependent) gre2 n=1 Tax=Sporothrix eucalyptigena TaxID=1812306 RepID=A0ABP0BF84_9PEZI